MAHTPKRLRRARKALGRKDYVRARREVGRVGNWTGRDRAIAYSIASTAATRLFAQHVGVKLAAVTEAMTRIAQNALSASAGMRRILPPTTFSRGGRK